MLLDYLAGVPSPVFLTVYLTYALIRPSASRARARQGAALAVAWL